ncbi:MAG: Mu transposase C-terminal domain-containing protein [Paracoccaceae bacterium]
MGAVGIRCDSKTGVIRFLGNEYWSPWLHAHVGEKVVARFDPADLRAGLHLYALDGGYLGLAECKVAAGFFDLEEARNHSAARRKWMKAEKAAAEAARKFKLAEIGDYLDSARGDDTAPDPKAKVVKPVFKKAAPTQQAPQASPEDEAAHAALVADFAAHKAQRPVPDTENDASLERYLRALELEARLADGEDVRRDDQRWLSSYQNSPEYRAHRGMHESFGDRYLKGGQTQ